jgi:cytidyltransferase-like protein
MNNISNSTLSKNNTSKDISVKAIISEFPKAALLWYGFKKDTDILYIYDGEKNSAIQELLMTFGRCVDVVAASDIQNCADMSCNNWSGTRYDYIVGMDVLEKCDNPHELLSTLKALLKSSGRLLLGCENRLAIKYFCGERDPYTNHSFDGIENYRGMKQADKKEIAGQCYSGAELRSMLDESGLVNHKFYAVMPNLREVQLVYAEGYNPQEELAIRYFPVYEHPECVFINEEYLYTDLVKNGMFHAMADAYIIECSMDGTYDDTQHVTLSMDRGRENALVTGICCGGGSGKLTDNIYDDEKISSDNKKKLSTVYKKAIYEEGIVKLKQMQHNHEELRSRGIQVVDSYIEDDKFIMPYVDAPVAMIALKELAKKDKEEFYKAIEEMYEVILSSSKHTDIISEKDKNSANGRDLGIILEKGYIDMVPLNCFYDGSRKNPRDRFIYYDQEFYIENCPAKSILHRSLSIIYDGTDKEFEQLIPRSEIMDRFGLTECEDIWSHMSSKFTQKLRNQAELETYYRNRRVNARTLYTNREKLNYDARTYQNMFIDIFRGLDDENGNQVKKLVLFGSGIFTNRFLDEFDGCYEVYSVIDNNSARWGTTIKGVPINSPDILKSIPADELHIIICIKKYYGVVRQLADWGIEDYHIYDPGNDYPNKRRENVRKRLSQLPVNDGNADDNGSENVQKETAHNDKPYNIGYIAGVFDLFHIGHLNMFRRAKELCNYLIVGVVSDEGVRIGKQAEPFVPFDERIEMVRSCRYVDEAVKLPPNFADTEDMYKVYHFDVQFSGSDYEHDPYWLARKDFLEKHGSTLVFFPYTQSTSSTKLKKAIDARISHE